MICGDLYVSDLHKIDHSQSVAFSRWATLTVRDKKKEKECAPPSNCKTAARGIECPDVQREKCAVCDDGFQLASGKCVGIHCVSVIGFCLE